MGRFEDATGDVVNFVEKIKDDNFPALDGARIKVMMDTKKRKSGRNYVIARIKKTNDELKAFAIDETGSPYDYVLFIDKMVWDNIEEDDKERIVFHELCHCVVDETENPYKIRDHEIQTFYAEIEFSRDDPRWSERIAVVAESLYNPEG